MVYFWDTSALAKRYFAEAGSARVTDLLAGDDSTHVASRLTLAEVPAAIVRRVQNAGTAHHPQGVADDLLARFDRDVAMLFSLSSFDDALADEAAKLVRRHRLRGCDALQLAAALRIFARDSETRFVCADDEMNTAASAEGLHVINPNDK